MHLTSREVNYLVWRYLQEEGLELSSHALDREAHPVDGKGPLIASYERGDLVRLLMKGMQLAEVEAQAAQAVEAGEGSPIKSEPLTKSLSPSTQPPVVVPAHELASEPASGPGLEPTKTLAAGSAVRFGGDLLAIGTIDKDAVLIGPDGKEVALRYAAGSSPDAHATAVAWAPGDQTIAIGSFSGSLRIWTADGALVKTLAHHAAPILSLKYNRDGTLLASVDVTGTLLVWDIAEGALKHASERPEGQVLVDMEWIDERTLATTHPDGVPLGGVAVYKLGEALPHVRFRGHIRAVTVLAFDQLSQLLASGGDDYVVNLWHARSPAPVRTLSHHRGPITALRWLPGPLGSALDGTKIASMLISGSADGTVVLWDLDATPPAVRWEVNFKAAVTLVEVNAADNLLAVAGSDSIRMYALSPQECKLIGKGSLPGALSLAWHDRILAVATNAGTAVFKV